MHLKVPKELLIFDYIILIARGVYTHLNIPHTSSKYDIHSTIDLHYAHKHQINPFVEQINDK